MTMRVLQVVPAISREASGPSHSVPSLCRALADTGATVTLHVLREGPSDYSNRSYRVESHDPWFGRIGRLGISPRMRRALARDIAIADVLHNNSLWMMPNVYPGRLLDGSRCSLVTSPRGVFAPWAWNRSRWRKQVMWWLGQRSTVERTDCFHVTSEAEYLDTRHRGLRAPIAVIPNGVEIPELVRDDQRNSRRLLFLGRIHPTKRVDLLVRAWAAVADRFADWELRIAGPDDDANYASAVRRLARELHAPRVCFAGPVYGQGKQSELFRASMVVLPSHSENFGMAVAEGLASGVPAIATRGTPWAGLQDEHCGWWVDGSVDALTACLEHALAMPRSELDAMGARGRAWMQREFSWSRIGEMMAATYRWLRDGGSTPTWVKLQ